MKAAGPKYSMPNKKDPVETICERQEIWRQVVLINRVRAYEAKEFALLEMLRHHRKCAG